MGYSPLQGHLLLVESLQILLAMQLEQTASSIWSASAIDESKSCQTLYGHMVEEKSE